MCYFLDVGLLERKTRAAADCQKQGASLSAAGATEEEQKVVGVQSMP